MTEIFVPLVERVVVSIVHVLEERLVLASSVKPLNGAGQVMRTSPLLWRFVIERNGNGQTVVVFVMELLARLGSTVSDPTDARLLMFPVAVGTTVKTIFAKPALAMSPSVPTIGTPLVPSVPTVVVADFSTTVAGSVFVRCTFDAVTGPALVMVMV